MCTSGKGWKFQVSFQVLAAIKLNVEWTLSVASSNSMVLNGEQLGKELDVTSDKMDEMRRSRKLYSFLDKRRKKMYGRKLRTDRETVRRAERDHYRTIAFREALANGSASRSEIFQYLEEMNGIKRTKTAFESNDVKQKYLEERESRRRDHFTRDHDARTKTSQLLLEFKTNPQDDVAVFYREDATHYDILGVAPDASAKTIRSKFSELSKIFHPDKRNQEDSAVIFRLLLEARNTLCNWKSKQKYDKELERKHADKENAGDS